MKTRISLTALSTALASAALAGGYDIQVLDFDGYDINVHGQVVGSALDGNGLTHAFTYLNGVTTELAPGTPDSAAYRINSKGQIAGKADFGTGHAHAALWSNGSAKDLGTLGGPGSFANDISEDGTVVGGANTANGLHAFVYTEADGMVDYGSQDPSDRFYFAGFNAINSKGQMTGTAYRLFSPYHASMGQVGKPGVTDINAPGQFSQGMGYAINEAGTMVGYSNGGKGSPEAAILHEDGSVEKLGRMGYDESWATDINDLGDIVGQAFGFDADGNQVSRAFLVEKGAMTPLDTLIPTGTGWSKFTDARAINALGQIVGTGVFNGVVKGFILTPQAVPEPTTFAALGLGVLALRRRRK